MYTEDFARKKRLTYLGGCLRYYDCSIFNYMHTNVSRCFQLSLFRFSIVCLVYMLSANLRISMFNIADTTKNIGKYIILVQILHIVCVNKNQYILRLHFNTATTYFKCTTWYLVYECQNHRISYSSSKYLVGRTGRHPKPG